MKHILKNPANPLAMLLMALAMALTFLACEEKKKPEAQQAETEAEATPTEEASEAVETPEAAEAVEKVVIIDESFAALMKEIIRELPDSLLHGDLRTEKREDIISSHYNPERVNNLDYGARVDWCDSDWHLAAYLTSDQENAMLMIREGGGCEAYGINVSKTLIYYIPAKKFTEIACPLEPFTAKELSPKFSDATLEKKAKAYFTDAYFSNTIEIHHYYRRDGFTASANLYSFCEEEDDNCSPSEVPRAYRKWNGSRFVKAELPPEED